MRKLTGKSVHTDLQRAILTGPDVGILSLSLIWEATIASAYAKVARKYHISISVD